MIPTAAVLAGAAIGGGLTCAAAGLLATRPELGSALTHLRQAAAEPPAPQRSFEERRTVARWLKNLAAIVPTRWVRVPRADLAVLGWTQERLIVQKLAAIAVGLALPGALFAVFAATGISLPLLFPAAATIALAVGMSLVPDLAARSQAAEARADLRRAIGAYFDLVALERAAEGGPVDALTRASTVAQGWAFRRIAATLAHARLTGVAPWVALGELAEELGVSELTDLGDVVALAGNDGAAIYETLLAKARSIRAATLAATEAQANSRSETITLPAALLGIGFIILVGYPALTRILTS